MVSMQEFIETYDLPFAPFREIVDTTNSLVAGSSALALYLQQCGVDPGFVPGDMDIWTEDTPELLSRSGAHQNSNLQLFTDLFLRHNYYVVSKSGPISESYEPLHSITKIYEFVNRDGKKIQLILLREKNLYAYIQRSFDLSICMSWWNSRNNVFETMFPRDTLKKYMLSTPMSYPLRENSHESKNIPIAGLLFASLLPCIDSKLIHAKTFPSLEKKLHSILSTTKKYAVLTFLQQVLGTFSFESANNSRPMNEKHSVII